MTALVIAVFPRISTVSAIPVGKSIHIPLKQSLIRSKRMRRGGLATNAEIRIPHTVVQQEFADA